MTAGAYLGGGAEREWEEWLEVLLDDRDCERCCNCNAHLVQRLTNSGHGAMWICPRCSNPDRKDTI